MWETRIWRVWTSVIVTTNQGTWPEAAEPQSMLALNYSHIAFVCFSRSMRPTSTPWKRRRTKTNRRWPCRPKTLPNGSPSYSIISQRPISHKRSDFTFAWYGDKVVHIPLFGHMCMHSALWLKHVHWIRQKNFKKLINYNDISKFGLYFASRI